ncbi:MAG: DegV family protein [Limnochordaceae bacterium]|nr:DegV family protein [Limnochordaceae bacterium]
MGHHVQVITDSTADLSPQLREQYHVGLIPLYVQLGEKAYRDGTEIQPAQLFDYVAQTGQLPKTSMPTPADFAAAFRSVIERGDDVLFIGIGASLSGTVQAARLAAEAFPPGRVRVVDSENLSTGVGLLVLRAAEQAAAGRTLDEIVAHLQAAVSHVRTSFIVNTMDYLYKGGRCSALQNVVGSLLRIRPRIEVVNGRLEVADKLLGARSKALRALLDWCLQDQNRIDRHRLFVTHVACPEEAEALAGELRQALPDANVLITEAGAVISSHCGPQTIGILYMVK